MILMKTRRMKMIWMRMKMKMKRILKDIQRMKLHHQLHLEVVVLG